MNRTTDLERQITDYYTTEAPTRAPDFVLGSILASVETTPQRRFGAARRIFPMNGNLPRLAAAAVIGLLVLVGGAIYLSNDSSGGVGGAPPVTATPTPTAIPSAAGGVPEPRRERLGSYGMYGSPPALMTVIVPEGWSVSRGAEVGRVGSAAEPNLIVTQVSNRFADACTDHTLYSPAPGPGVDELIETVANQPGIQAGPITEVTVDGYTGKSVELTSMTDSSTCSDGEFPVLASPDGTSWGMERGGMGRVFALDVDGSRYTFVARFPADIVAADRAALEAIIDSIDIEPLPSTSPSP